MPREQFGKYIAAHSVGAKNKLRCEPLSDGTSAACGRELSSVKVDAKGIAGANRVRGVLQPSSRLGCGGTKCLSGYSIVENVPACFPLRANPSRSAGENKSSRGRALKACLEEPQAQDLELDLDPGGNWKKETHTRPRAEAKSVSEAENIPVEQRQMPKPFEGKANSTANGAANLEKADPLETRVAKSTGLPDLSPESMLGIWQEERGPLAELRALSPERVARCRERISHASLKGKSIAQFLADFREAVARAAVTPFLRGEGPTGWCANFDWLVADDTNYLEGS